MNLANLKQGDLSEEAFAALIGLGRKAICWATLMSRDGEFVSVAASYPDGREPLLISLYKAAQKLDRLAEGHRHDWRLMYRERGEQDFVYCKVAGCETKISLPEQGDDS